MKIVVDGAGFKELNQEYVATSADEIPTGIFPSNNFFYSYFISRFRMGLPAERLECRRYMEGAERELNLVQSFNSSAFSLL